MPDCYKGVKVMKIVVAPDSFKESLTALDAAKAIKEGFQEVFPDANIQCVPMADGGEGTVQSLIDGTGGTIKEVEVTGPLGEPVKGFYGILGDGKTAIIEMAAASGLQLVPPAKRNPLITTTKGTGELILDALDEGIAHIIMGIGGSATNDGGAGMVQVLGAKLLDDAGKQIDQGGKALADLSKIDLSGLDPRIRNVKFEVACDVDNPLTGPNGASHIYGPQKGATPEMIELLDANLLKFAEVIERDLQLHVNDIPGAGAAGGIGAGLLAFLSAELKRGIDIVITVTDLEKHVQDADLVITGEGRIDSQTIFGKTPIGVAKTAKKFNIPVIGIAGSISQDSHVVYDHGIDALYSVVPGAMPLEDALENAYQYLLMTARNIARTIQLYQ